MKHLILFITLFISASFYAQDEVYVPVEAEGFFINEMYLDEERFVMYELFEGRVIQPIYLYLPSEEMTESFKNIINTAYIKIKGKRKKDSLRNDITVTEITAVDNNNLLIDYLKEKQPKVEKLVNQPYEGEGYVMQLPGTGLIFIPKKEENVCYPFELAIVDTPLSHRQEIIMQGVQEGIFVSPLTIVKGIRNSGELYNEIKIERLDFFEVIFENEHFFKSNDSRRIIQNVEYFEEEGFYCRGFEESEFRILKGDTLHSYGGNVKFDERLEEDKRYEVIAKDFDRYTIDKSRGVYMKVKGVRTYGGLNGYGHFGVRDYELYITDIIEMDTKRTLWDFIENKWAKDGDYLYKEQQLTQNSLLEENRTYTFTGSFDNGDPRTNKQDIYTVKLDVVRKGIYLDYKYVVYNAKGKIKKKLSGQNMLAFNWFEIGFNDRYEAKDKKMRRNDFSLLTILIGDRENGELTGEIHDYIDRAHTHNIKLVLRKTINP